MNQKRARARDASRPQMAHESGTSTDRQLFARHGNPRSSTPPGEGGRGGERGCVIGPPSRDPGLSSISCAHPSILRCPLNLASASGREARSLAGLDVPDWLTPTAPQQRRREWTVSRWLSVDRGCVVGGGPWRCMPTRVWVMLASRFRLITCSIVVVMSKPHPSSPTCPPTRLQMGVGIWFRTPFLGFDEGSEKPRH